MIKYKSVVTDYEGMQALLDSHASLGWRLFSLTPDTWRKSVASDGTDSPPFDELTTSGKPTEEYSASYYLLIFEREDFLDDRERAISAEETLPKSQRQWLMDNG
jgi:hypothetical protein